MINSFINYITFTILWRKYNLILYSKRIFQDLFLDLASFGYCVEALILSFVSLYIFNPVGNALFDRYAIRNSRRNEERNLEMNPLNSR